MLRFLLPLLVLAAAAGRAAEGYDDTPMLPDGKWRVHDKNRPMARVVTPGGENHLPPSDAQVLFDGSNLAAWIGREAIKEGDKVVGHRDVDARWKIENGYAEVNKTGDIRTRDSFGSCQLHIEWQAPNPPKGKSQGRGNSGIFFMERYECQVLDTFENETYADGAATAMYGQTPPLVNACRKPGEWQTYDIIFNAPNFEDGKLVRPASMTVFHNGVLTQNHTELLGATAHKQVAKYSAHPDKLPIRLQDHGDPVRFRNIWIRPLD
jgi:hypothetical protein